MSSITIFLAYLVDLVVGDPPRLPHPVVMIGNLISKLEGLLYKEEGSPRYKLLAGGLLVAIVLLAAYSLTWLIIGGLNLIHPWLGFLASVWLISTTIAAKGLKDVGVELQGLLRAGDMTLARTKVGYIVGRDTQSLDEEGVTRATVETIAENIVDGITSPLFFALVGGAPLAMTYRAVNTLDSMLGYKNERYLYFGRVAARTDDVFNYLPARLTGLIIALVALVLPGYSGTNSFKIYWRDSRNHPSPNSGFSESAVSGALGVRLGGINYYHGQASQRPYIGEPLEPLTADKIRKTITIMLATSFTWALLMTGIKFLASL